MILVHIYAGSLVAAFIAWYLCLLIPNHWARGILRTGFIAFLCAPGILVGHGIGVAPMVFALSVQPFIFNLLSILVAWIVALAVVFGVPALRNDRGQWPPSAEVIFLGFYPGKFVLFGLLAAMLMWSLIYADQQHSLWVDPLKYVLFFAAAVVNLALCYWAIRLKQASPLVTPLYFSIPVLLVSPPNVALMWYGAGAIGGLAGSEHHRIASWISLGVFGLLSANSILRVYYAANAAPHVKIGGGVIGNAAMATLFAALAITGWWLLRRADTRTSQQDESGVKVK